MKRHSFNLVIISVLHSVLTERGVFFCEKEKENSKTIVFSKTQIPSQIDIKSVCVFVFVWC